MEYTTITHDIETIKNRIKRGTIKMDSDFQRGEVWNLPKKQKLIDTILRGWPIPPVQIVKLKDSEEILDGLQRISSIIEFLNGGYTIDGGIQPRDSELEVLDGLTFLEIKQRAENDEYFKQIYNKILTTSISAYYIKDPTSEEIAELFYRFNSPMQLNPVEKRNAFMGDTRTTIKQLNEFFIEHGASKETLGFNDIRGLYEDILVKVCYFLEFPKKRVTKLTSDKLIELYRANYCFSNNTITTVRSAIVLLLRVLKIRFKKNTVRLSRTTVFSILLFICNNFYNINSDIVYRIIKFSTGKFLESSEIYHTYRYLSTSGTTDPQNINQRELILNYVSFKNANDIINYGLEELYANLGEYMRMIGV